MGSQSLALVDFLTVRDSHGRQIPRNWPVHAISENRALVVSPALRWRWGTCTNSCFRNLSQKIPRRRATLFAGQCRIRHCAHPEGRPATQFCGERPESLSEIGWLGQRAESRSPPIVMNSRETSDDGRIVEADTSADARAETGC
jgi:hypothetical protein